MADTSPAVPVILYVEDDNAAALLFRIALSKLRPETTLHVVDTRSKALAFLHRRNPYEAVMRPHLVVLDLHLPDGTGFDVLDDIRQDTKLTALPVLFFSTSRLPRHHERAALWGAQFIVKPLPLAEYEQAVAKIHGSLPPMSENALGHSG